ncbi:hypothetical protein NGRA_2192 [Nosema granulosis]|uniref:Uncharacterized protein n=1 Tax=Nosema granulosis TaxID=83296 RepID=A0A9P6GXH0_9MICR|nr:hypothetical protein NGRA_2192 [Nosema granulosis]
MFIKIILRILSALFALFTTIIVLFTMWVLKKSRDIDFVLEAGNKNITPELKNMYRLTDEQCEQVYAGIFILYMVPLEDTKRIINFDDNKIKKIEEGKSTIRFAFFSKDKSAINKNFSMRTVPKKIVDLVKTPYELLEFNEDFRPIADKLILKFKTQETLLRKKIEGGKNYNIVETIIATMPELLREAAKAS